MTHKEKDRISYAFATLSFIIGWLLTILGFYTDPVGEISNSVLTVLGESLVFTGSILGISFYYKGQLDQFKTEISEMINKSEKKK